MRGTLSDQQIEGSLTSEAFHQLGIDLSLESFESLLSVVDAAITKSDRASELSARFDRVPFVKLSEDTIIDAEVLDTILSGIGEKEEIDDSQVHHSDSVSMSWSHQFIRALPEMARQNKRKYGLFQARALSGGHGEISPCSEEVKVIASPLSGDSVDVIIPIHNAPAYLEKCLDSVFKNTAIDFNLLLVDDCSADERVASILKEAEQRARPKNMLSLKVERLSRNIGFPGAVNVGLRQSLHHAVILNSDTEVPPGWLGRLIKPLLEDSTIASVTPLSNRATICSFPRFCEDNDLPSGVSTEEMDREIARCGINETIEIPTGVGFCMAMSRAALDAVGFFDQELFGVGYGEENDWCFRAAKAGYRSVAIANLFVFHDDGASFATLRSASKIRRIENNLEKVEVVHPEYSFVVQQFLSYDPLQAIRDHLLMRITESQERHSKSPSRKHILYVTNQELGGGSHDYLFDRIENRTDDEIAYLLDVGPTYATFREFGQDGKASVKHELANLAIEDFRSLLDVYQIDEIFVNQLVGADVFKLINLIGESGKPYTYFIHDYFCACPTVNLIRADYTHCDCETKMNVCQGCIAEGVIPDMQFANPEGIDDISRWRSEFSTFLKLADQVIAPSVTAAAAVNKYYPKIVISVVEHTLINPPTYTWLDEFSGQDNLVVGVVGAIGFTKGANVIKALHTAIRERELPIKIQVIGITRDIQEMYESPCGTFAVSGRYAPEEISQLLAEYSIGVVFIPAIWPETFSYTTVEALQSGFPVASLNIGAPAEHVRNTGGGWIIEQSDADCVADFFQMLASDREQIRQCAARLKEQFAE